MRKNCVEKAATKPWWHHHPVLAPFRPVVLPVPGKIERRYPKLGIFQRLLITSHPSFVFFKVSVSSVLPALSIKLTTFG